MKPITFLDVLCNKVIGEIIMIHLNIRNIAVLMRTCKRLHKHLNLPEIWRSLNRIHFQKTPLEIYQQSYHMENICGYETYTGAEWFTCTNSPVYINTACIICSEHIRICEHCVRRERIIRIFCTCCDLFYHICDTCDILNQDSNITDKFHICGLCNEQKCGLHFDDEPEVCVKCFANMPELLGYTQLDEESVASAEYESEDDSIIEVSSTLSTSSDSDMDIDEDV